MVLVSSLIPSDGFGADKFCRSEAGYKLSTTPRKSSLAIRLFDIAFRPAFPIRYLEDLRMRLAESLRRGLTESGFFTMVAIPAEDEDPEADYVLSGVFKDVQIGTNSYGWVNLLTDGADEVASWVSIQASIKRRGSDTPETMFECFAGVVKGTANGKARRSVSAMTNELSKKFRDMARRDGGVRR